MDSWPRRHLRLLLTAVRFYTRLPVPAWVGYSEELMQQSSRYLPLVGWLVGAVAAVVWWAAAHVWPPTVAALLSTGAGILLTGAFHEDGLADVCDGFGGGWTAERILAIMKDSRVGTYGVVGLGLVLATKVAALHSAGAAVPALLLVAHPLSRLVALSFLHTHQYARTTPDSKAQAVAKLLPFNELLIAAAWGLLPLLALAAWQRQPGYLLVLLPLAGLQLGLGRWFQRWLGGYTGDCLGAAQQLAEVLIYLLLTARFA
jgi:adenosylcobinamide-GDP ribazoletransferase